MYEKNTLEEFLGLARDAGYQALPQAKAYFQKPTFENAENLLKALNLHIPFKNPVQITHKRKAKTSEDNKPLPVKRRVSVLGGASDSAITFSKKIQVLSHVDFLHDIHLYPLGIDKEIFEGVLLPLGLNTDQYKQVSSWCNDRKTHDVTFSSRVTGFLEHMFHKNPKRTRLEQINADTMLHKWITTWMQQSVLEVVIDGFLQDPLDPTIDDAMVVRCLCMASFFQLVIGRFPSIIAMDPPTPNIHGKVPDVRVLTGRFQTMDSPVWEKFMTRFVDSFNREVQTIHMVLVSVPTKSHQPYDDRIKVTSTHAIIDGVWNVPLTKHKKKVSGVPSTRYEIVQEFEETTHTSYSKDDLKYVFQTYAKCTQKERSKMKIFQDRIIRLNAMRDMYKADVALRRGAMYLTVDRTAYLYYTLRAEYEDKNVQGFYYFPVTKGYTEIVTEM